MENKKCLTNCPIWLSVAALVLAALVSLFSMDLWLAGTQWILVAIVLAVYAIYLNLRETHKND